MNDKEWLAAQTGEGLDLAERYITEAKGLGDPIAAIDRYLVAIDMMHVHLGRMETASEGVKQQVAEKWRSLAAPQLVAAQ